MVFLTLFKPRWDEANKALKHAGKPNYDEIGKTEDESLKSQKWMIDKHQIQLGKGEKVYNKAKNAINNWEQFQLGWACVPAAGAIPLEIGQQYAVCGRTLGVWSTNPLQVLYKYEKNVTTKQKKHKKVFGVGSSTLKGHLLAGEESFRIEWDKSDNSVWYKIYTFSKPCHPLAALTYPIVRLHQTRFAKDSMNKMVNFSQG
eukprot:TRINITY_DN28249_c0_g1_i4.p2 TRINITY_DN28249_c0_g1~~TRINITY_DN28249_c0_g1_i4.p2  ORF type:complete len:201 (-),score=25.74 TRINITY_DN28249_c0_g1_i4:748-1350(-)